jgi:SAM-dependent methyltransferase
MATAGARFTPADEVAHYFSEYYPGRTGFLSRFFRKGEAELRAMTKRAIEAGPCRSILDLGCGDGLMLKAALPHRLDRLLLVDLVGANVEAAAAALKPLARDVETRVADVREVDAAASFDLVLMLGVLDYLPDWPDTLHRLASTVSGRLLVDLPRSDRFWHRLRHLRLSLFGVALFRATRGEIERVFDGLPGRVEIVAGKLSWFCLYEPGRAR